MHLLQVFNFGIEDKFKLNPPKNTHTHTLNIAVQQLETLANV